MAEGAVATAELMTHNSEQCAASALCRALASTRARYRASAARYSSARYGSAHYLDLARYTNEL